MIFSAGFYGMSNHQHPAERSARNDHHHRSFRVRAVVIVATRIDMISLGRAIECFVGRLLQLTRDQNETMDISHPVFSYLFLMFFTYLRRSLLVFQS